MIVIFIILGLIMASFYTVVAIRIPNNESILKPGSHCDSCSHALKWYELIPVFSYIIFKGRCHKCHAKIPVLYPIIEVTCGLLFGLAYYLYGFSYELIASLTVISLMIIIIISDFKYLVILDGPTLLASIVILITKLIYFGPLTFGKSLMSGLAIFIFMLLIRAGGNFAFKRESLGGGDIKLSFFIGCLLGIKMSFIVLVIASFIALPYALYYVLKKQEKEIPFGPFLIIATFITFIFMNQINWFINLVFLIK